MSADCTVPAMHLLDNSHWKTAGAQEGGKCCWEYSCTFKTPQLSYYHIIHSVISCEEALGAKVIL